MNIRGILQTRSSHQQQDKQITSLVLLLLSFLPYANTLAGKFVDLDHFQVVKNPYAHSFHYLSRIFESSTWSFLGNQGVNSGYRPMMSFAYLLIYKVAGWNPVAFHFVNLILHALSVYLVFCIVRRLSGERVAMVSAGLFALHPIHTESVAWVGGMSQLEVSVFFLLAFLLYVKLSDPSSGVFVRLIIWISFVLALLSNEVALTFPVLVTIFEHLYRQDRVTTSLRQKIARYGLIWGVATVYFAVRTLLVRTVASDPYSTLPMFSNDPLRDCSCRYISGKTDLVVALVDVLRLPCQREIE